MKKVQVKPFGTIGEEDVKQYTVEFKGKLKVEFTNFGGIVMSLKVPDNQGQMENVLLGHKNLENYLDNPTYLGALIGRYGNRIARGIFQLDGKTYKLATNNGPNHLHGGTKGFDQVVWDVVDISESNEEVKIVLQYISNDMEEGYPGQLKTQVIYIFTPHGFGISYMATTDTKTIFNPTHHAYFNLSGGTKEDILSHVLQLDADAYLPVDQTMIPTGELAVVDNTPFDFRKSKPVGKDIDSGHEQLAIGQGYDHCWVLNGGAKDNERRMASLYHKTSGRFMEVYTTEPGVQFYSGNFLDGIKDDMDNPHYHRSGLCLETQHFPDSPNNPHFPGVVLDVGEEFKSSTTFKFSIQ